MIDGMDVKGKSVIIPSQLQMQILRQLQRNHMGIEKTRLLVHESVYWVNMNADIENAVKQCSTHLEYQNMELQVKLTSKNIPAKPWEVVVTLPSSILLYSSKIGQVLCV